MRPSPYHRRRAKVPNTWPVKQTLATVFLFGLAASFLTGLAVLTVESAKQCEPSQYRQFAPFEPTRKALKQYAAALRG